MPNGQYERSFTSGMSKLEREFTILAKFALNLHTIAKMEG
jgi:hypothetical protein